METAKNQICNVDVPTSNNKINNISTTVVETYSREPYLQKYWQDSPDMDRKYDPTYTWKSATRKTGCK